MIRPTDPGRLEATQADLRARLAGGAPRVLNDRAVASIVEGTGFEFPADSGVHFVVPPVHYRKGARLECLALELQEARRAKPRSRESIALVVSLQDKCMRELCRLVRPVSLWRRALWPLRWRLSNPFRHCTGQEVAQLLLFFFSLTTRSRVRFSRPT